MIARQLSCLLVVLLIQVDGSAMGGENVAREQRFAPRISREAQVSMLVVSLSILFRTSQGPREFEAYVESVGADFEIKCLGIMNRQIIEIFLENEFISDCEYSTDVRYRFTVSDATGETIFYAGIDGGVVFEGVTYRSRSGAAWLQRIGELILIR
jgi:hypothetical protein